jgi:FtsP/CotA-like multicopper oxidase with cupredoxin domain
MSTRRHFLSGAIGGATLTALASARAEAVQGSSLIGLPELVTQTSPDTQPPLPPHTGPAYRPVTTLNGWTLPWRMKDGVKEFHLVAEPVEREIAPGMVARLWGYNGQSPGPTIEVVEGDRLRIYVTNRLPEVTTVHWHGQRLPNGMDGVTGLTQAGIAPGKTCVYEFTARRPGTFMYHPHADEMVQMAMGLMGSWVTHPHPKRPHPHIAPVDRDLCFLLNAYDIEPGASQPKTNTMLDFNLWTWNSRAFPGIDPICVRQGERVRLRIGNLTMTNHPIHLHGMEFMVTGTDGGAVPPSARWPEVTTDIGVGQMRQIEFTADEPGDWSLHCHKSHHTMNAMGHNVPNLIGVNQKDLVKQINKLVPGYMAMGEKGMHDMGDMAMDLPDNTLPMMSGDGPFGAIGMGGMFTVLKVRRDQPPAGHPDAAKDPGWFRQPPGTAARFWQEGDAMPPPASRSDAAPGAPAASAARPSTVLTVRKPGEHGQGGSHGDH